MLEPSDMILAGFDLSSAVCPETETKKLTAMKPTDSSQNERLEFFIEDLLKPA
jgi:hypothetical protein